jgi:TolB-like protein
MPDPLPPIELAREAEFALGPLLIRPSERTVVVEGREELLEPRVMQVLVALGRRAGKVLSRDDLVAACWGGRVVGEDAIGRPVAVVRKMGETSGAFTVDTIPRVGYRLRPTTPAAAAPAQEVPPGAEPVLAVLAFDNLSGDPNLAYFSDGISDEILQAVSRALKTIGRASSFRFRGPDKAVHKVSAELGATHILDGSVRRNSEIVRINAQLIEAASQTTIWQEQFDRPLTDLFAVQDEVAIAVAGALDRRLALAPGQPEIDQETYQSYLYLRHMVLRHAGSVDQTLISTAEQITRQAPTFGPGWIEAARLRVRAKQHFPAGTPEARSHHEEALRAIARATQLLGSENPAVTALSVNMAPWCGAWTACEKRLRESLASWPYEVPAMVTMADLLMHAGRGSEAVVVTREIYDREPFEARYAVVHGFALNVVGRLQEEFVVLEAACRRWPDSPWIWRMLVTAAAQADRWDIVDRWTTPERTAGLPPHSAIIRTAKARLAVYRNADGKTREALFPALAEAVEQTGRVDLPELAFASQFCDLDAIYGLIERASFDHLFDPAGFGNSDSVTLFLAHAKLLRSDPRFLGLCARLGLVAHWIETGRWPDCADTVPYDFRLEAERAQTSIW